MDKMGIFYDKIEAYITGLLSQAETSAMEKAMQTDEALAQAVALRRMEFDVSEAVIADDIRAQFAALRNNGNAPENEQQAPETATKNIRPPWLVIALSIGIGLLGIAVLWRFFFIQPPTTNEPRSIPSVRDTIAPPERLPAAPTASLKPPVANTIEKTKTPRPPAQAQTNRMALAGALYKRPDFETLRAGANDAVSPIAVALDAMKKGDYPSAIGLLEPIPSSDPLYWKYRFLLGHALYGVRKYGQAGDVFSAIAAGKQQPWAEESEWYAVLSLLASGKASDKDFESLLGKIASDEGHTFQTEAADLRGRLGLH